MAVPTNAATASSSSTSQAINHAITLPAGIVAGHLLVVFFSTPGTGLTNSVSIDTAISGKGWVKALENIGGSVDPGLEVFWKIAEGGDVLSLVVNGTSPGLRSTHRSFRITGHGGTVVAASVAGNSANADPPNAAQSGSAQDTLCLTAVALPSNAVATVAPAGYANLLTLAPGLSNTGLSTADKGATVISSDNPGTFTSASARWNAATVLIGSTAITTSARATQEAVEAASIENPPARITQLAVEVLSANALKMLLTQLAVEMISTNVADDIAPVATTSQPALLIIAT